MHSYLKTIGFSQIKNRIELEELVKRVIQESSSRQLFTQEDGTIIAELALEVAPGVGLMVRGEFDDDQNFHREHYFPFYKGQNISVKEQMYISKRVDTDAFTGMCDDYRLGVSLIFYLQNAIDFIQSNKPLRGAMVCSVSLVGLASEGKIILPVEKKEQDTKLVKGDIKYRSQLIAEAKKGNQEAIDSLTIDDIDLYAMVSKRIKNEDVYSIVETSFVPYGTESDNYTILGIITDVRETVNSITKENLYILNIECNGLTFEVCINKSNLYGEPEVGRRFQGTIWMQGTVDFNNNLT